MSFQSCNGIGHRQLSSLCNMVSVVLCLCGVMVAGGITEVRNARRWDMGLHTEIFGHKAKMNTLIRPTKLVRQMQPDLSVPGNILFINDIEILTTNGRVIKEAGFNTTGLFTINSFQQISQTESVAAVHWSHCLVTMNRLTQKTKPLLASCSGQDAGKKDGQLHEAQVTYPMDLILSKTNTNTLYLSEITGTRIMEIDLSLKTVTTVMTSNVCVPVRMVMNDKGDSIYFTSGGKVCKFYLPTKASYIVAGSHGNFGYYDYSLLDSLFRGLEHIVQISPDMFIVADPQNHRLRILDMSKDRVSSICDGGNRVKDGTLTDCEMKNPYSLMFLSGVLYVGEQDSIRVIEGLEFAPTTSPTTTSSTTTTTTRRPTTETQCQDVHLIQYLKEGQTLATVNMPGKILMLPIGDYQIDNSNTKQQCKWFISIKASPITTTTTTTTTTMPTSTTTTTTTMNPPTSPQPIFPCSPIYLTQPLQAGQSSAKVSLPGRTLLLPVGDYEFENLHNGQFCRWFVRVKGPTTPIQPTVPTTTTRLCKPARITAMIKEGQSDANVQLAESLYIRLQSGTYSFILGSTLDISAQAACTIHVTVGKPVNPQATFSSEYKVRCTDIQDRISQTAISNVAVHHYKQIELICAQDCRVPTGAQPVVSCSNDLLLIQWLTDLPQSQSGSLSDTFKQSLIRRVKAATITPSIVLLDKIPPVLFPEKSPVSGSYINVQFNV